MCAAISRLGRPKRRAIVTRCRHFTSMRFDDGIRVTASNAGAQKAVADLGEGECESLRILQPKRFGGMQGRFNVFSRIVEELTYGWASSAWVYAVLAEHQWIIGQYPEAAQIDVWGEDPLAVPAIDVATLLLHNGRNYSTAEVSSGRRITEAEALRARRDMVYAQHQVSWALDRLCEMDGARWVYDNDELGAIRRDVMTILTHHAASRQAAMAPYGKMLLTRDQAKPASAHLSFARPRRRPAGDFARCGPSPFVGRMLL